jgi:hypothetical protein
VGDVVYVVRKLPKRIPFIEEWQVKAVKKDAYICTDGTPGKGKRISRHQAETRQRAEQEWKDKLKEEFIETHLSEIEYWKGILRDGPRVEPMKGTPGQ